MVYLKSEDEFDADATGVLDNLNFKKQEEKCLEMLLSMEGYCFKCNNYKIYQRSIYSSILDHFFMTTILLPNSTKFQLCWFHCMSTLLRSCLTEKSSELVMYGQNGQNYDMREFR